MTFLPGQSGNPGGSGTRKIFRDAINMEMLMHERGELDPVPRASARGLIRAQIMKAADGDLAALAFLCERAEGKASVQIGGSEWPIQLEVSRGEDAAARIAAQLAEIGRRGVEVAAVAAVEDDEEK